MHRKFNGIKKFTEAANFFKW